MTTDFEGKVLQTLAAWRVRHAAHPDPVSVIDPAFIWPDDRFEVLSRLSCATWIVKQWLLEDLGWDRLRLETAILGIRDLEISLCVSSARDAVLLSGRTKSLALVTIKGYENRMDEVS